MTGGFIDDEFTLNYIKKENYDVTFAVDRGLLFFDRTGRTCDYIVGDFDSVGGDVLKKYLPVEGGGQEEALEKADEAVSGKKPKIVRLNPMKDDTDTEHALEMAIRMGCDSIHLFGATGSRLDHVLGNLQLLGYALRNQVECLMIDPNNRIRLIDRETVIEREKQFGAYVSLIPYTPKVTGLTLTGFVYPLRDYTMSSFYVEDANTISGVSNEIDGERGVISLTGGILVLVEARDE